MNPKILVADDSPTIQKVVSITLAGSDYLLEAAHNESELFEKLATDSFDLVLLDFNLSEDTSGYDLSKKIKEVSQGTKTLVMLGTFDSVEDHSMKEAGVVDQIIKPFESSLFIEKVKGALEGEESLAIESIELESNESEWVMDNAPSDQEDQVEEVDFLGASEPEQANALNEVMSGWGMSVPSVIGDDSGTTGLPPKMEELGSDDALTDGSQLAQEIIDNEDYEEVSEEVTMPTDDQLDYPDLGEDSHETSSPTSKLVSLEDLETDQLVDLEEDDDIDDTDPQFVIGPSEDSPDLIDALEEDVTPDEFWAADQNETDSIEEQVNESSEGIGLIDLGEDEDEFLVDQHVPVSIGAETEEINTPTIDALNDLSISDDVGPKLEKVEVNFDYDEILSRLKQDLRPIIKEVIQEVLDESNTVAAEKVAWEIIPDLAENLIRKEVENLSKKVQEKHSLS